MVPIGIIVNVFSIFLGGFLGALGGRKMSTVFRNNLNMAFSIASITMGIYTIAPMQNLAAVIFAIIIGTGIGTLLHFGDYIKHGAE